MAADSGEAVVMVTGGLTVTDNACGRLTAPVESVTLALKGYCATDVIVGAVPETDEPFRWSQAGWWNLAIHLERDQPDTFRASVAVMLNWKVPAEGGVPLGTLPFKESHAGMLTLRSRNVYGAVPPAALRVTEKNRVAVQGPSDGLLVMVTPGFTVSENVRALEEPRESVAVAVKENDVGSATVVAVPLIAGPVSKSHDGRLVKVQVMVPVPPVAANVSE
jgi:hypothetical protein